RIASMMDRFTAIRSVIGATGGHDAFQCMTGWDHRSLKSMGGRPSLGSVVSKLQGPVDPSVPAFVGLAARTQHVPWSDSGVPGFLGPAYAPFKPDGPGMSDLTLRGISRDQLADRRRLLGSFDALRHDLDTSGAMDGMDANTARALGVLTSSKLLDALDIDREPEIGRRRY